MNKRFLFFLGISIGLIGLFTLFAPATARTVSAAAFCECVAYVQNRFGLPTGAGIAANWNDGFLQSHGFSSVSVRVGAIVVMEGTHPDVSSTAGHVGVVESYNSSTGKITVRGANQGASNLTTEYNCNNVNSVTFSTSVHGRSDISFWERQQAQVGDVRIEVRNGSNQLMGADIGLRLSNGAVYGASSATGVYTVSSIPVGSATISARNGSLYTERNVTISTGSNNFTLFLGTQCTRSSDSITPRDCPPIGNDNAQFIADITVPDGTVFSPNNTFTKTWRIKNNGTSTWSTGYKLAFQYGYSMSAPGEVSISRSVAPGSTIDISVNMTAPSSAGSYRGNWKMKNAAGTTFGELIWVDIRVQGGSSGGQVKLYALANFESLLGSYSPGSTQDPNRNSYSLDIPSGWSVITYRGNNYDGESRCWNTRVPNLQDHSDWQNKIDSMIVYDYDRCPPPVTDTTAPTGRMTAPAMNSSMTGPVIRLAATASDNMSGVKKVDFYAWSNDSWSNQQWIYLGTDTSSPYEYDWNVSGLGANTGAFVTINVTDNANNESGYIWDPNWTSFSISNVVNVPNAPVLANPFDGNSMRTDQAPYLTWSGNGTQYYGEMWGGPNGTQSFGWQSETFKPMGLQPGGYIYKWRVKARNSAGESAWSPTWSFSVGDCSYYTNSSAILFFSTNCYGYISVISLGETNLSNHNDKTKSIYIPTGKSVRVWSDFNRTGASKCLTSTAWNLDGYLYDNGTPIFASGASTISSVEFFNSNNCNTVAVPTLSSPANNLVASPGQTVTLQWSGVGTEYYGELSGGPNGTQTFGWQTQTSKSISSLTTNFTYKWRVKARSGGIESGWSAYRTFYIGDCNTLTNTQAVIFDDSDCHQPLWSAPASGVTNDLGQYNDRAESMFVPAGKSVRVWSDINRTGSTKCITGIVWNFANLQYENGAVIGNTISSIESFTTNNCTAPVVPTGCAAVTYNGAILYNNKNCSGTSKLLNTTTFTKLVVPINNNVNSIYVKPGWSVKLFENKDKTGGKLCVNTKTSLDGLVYSNGKKVLKNGVSTVSAAKLFKTSSCK